jgi:hypothetical protein
MSKILTIVDENKLILLNGTTNYGHDYGHATYNKTAHDIVVITGLVKSKEFGVLAQLPEGYRPKKKLVFNVNNNDTSARVDVFSDGRIMWINGNKCHGYGNISLSGINFYVGDEVEPALPLKNDWVDYGGDYETPKYIKTNSNIVVVSGMAKDGGWGLIAHLPEGVRPKKRLVFNVNNNNSSCRIDVLQDGRIIWVNGGENYGWVSLSGIIFSIETGSILTITNCWKPYGDTYENPAFNKTSNGLVTLSGRIHYGTKGVLAKLPSWCQPTKRLVFNLRNSHRTSRVDVLPDGRIIWINGGSCNGDISFSGIVFFAEYGHHDAVDNIVADNIVADSITAESIISTNITSTNLDATNVDIGVINSQTINNSGNITNTGDITSNSFITTSDKRYKKDIQVIQNCLDKVKKIRGVNFKWIKDNRDDFGVIAQEVEEVAPYAVKEGTDGIKRVDYSKLTVILIEAIKEQSIKIDELSAKVNSTAT